MGAYLDRPKTQKDTESGTLELPPRKELPFAVSQMQGWRKTMEDAHIAAVNLENSYDVPPGTHLFAVFDGHGGKEVADFCAKHFLETLLDLESFKARAYREALIECFHKMDELLLNPKYKNEIDRFAGKIVSPEVEADLAKSFDDLDNRSEESNPVEDFVEVQVPERKSPDSEELRHDKEELDKERVNSLEEHFGLTNNEDSEERSVDDETDLQNVVVEKVEDTEGEGEGDFEEDELSDRKESTNLLAKPDAEAELNKELENEKKQTKSDSKSDSLLVGVDGSDLDSEASSGPKVSGDHALLDELEGDDPPDIRDKNDNSEEDDLMKKAEKKGSLSKVQALNMMLRVLRLTNSNGQDMEEGDGDDEPLQTAGNTNTVPPPQPRRTNGIGMFDSDAHLPTSAGTTACVALIIEGKVYVANAGDSRAVLCKDKQAEALSYDHKPTQPTEKTRIEAAGGWVTGMGRVCGNLNLSRCIGDLKYKQNEMIDKAKQVITAEPDVNSAELSDDDMFLVIACDGVWDIMTNDNIVDFIGAKLVEHARSLSDTPLNDQERHLQTVSKTVEDVFSACLCADPMRSEGKGGDNMTCVVVCLRPLDDILQAYWE